MEHLVAFQKSVELLCLLMTVAAKKHPQILYCGSHATVIKINEHGSIIPPEDVASVAVCMDTNGGVPAISESFINDFQKVACECVVGLYEGGRDAVVAQ